MSWSIVSFIGWTFLPALISSAIQTVYYGIAIRAGEPKPQPGTPKHALHKRRIEIGVTIAYLLYSLYESHWNITHIGDYYTVLSVSPLADDKAIQSKFRRLTLLYHPDKVAASTPRAEAETYYISLQTARDTLLSPPLRYAYDRFGPQALDWKSKKTTADYITHGLQNAVLPYYAVSGIVLLCFGYVGMLSYGAYWRYLAFLAMAAFELRTVTGLAPPLPCVIIPATIRRVASLLQYVGLSARAAKTLASYAPQPYLPFQVLEFMHSATVSVFLALSQLGPLLEEHYDPGKAEREGTGSEEAKLAKLVTRLEAAVGAGHAEMNRHIALETVPYREPDESAESSMVILPNENKKELDRKEQVVEGSSLGMLKGEIKDWLFNNTVRNDAQVQAAYKRVVERRGGVAQ